MVIPIGTIVTAVTGVKGCFWCRSSSQGQFSNAVKMFTFCACVLHSVVKCVQSSGQATKMLVKIFDPGHRCDHSAYGSETGREGPPPDSINFVPCHNTSTRDIVTTQYICTILVSLSCYIDQASPSPTYYYSTVSVSAIVARLCFAREAFCIHVP